MRDLYLKYNPVIVFVMRPTLRLVDAHNNPRIGGIAAALASGLIHYGIVLPFVWKEGGPVSSFLEIPLLVHFCFGMVILSNLMIGFGKYYQSQNNLARKTSRQQDA